MSDVQQNTTHLSPAHPSNPPDIASLVKMLDEAARALSAIQPEVLKSPLPADENGEIRSYYVPANIVERERELLARHQAEDFRGLLDEAHTMLRGLVNLMLSVNPNTKVKGPAIASLGKLLEQVLGLLLRMRNIYRDVTPMRK